MSRIEGSAGAPSNSVNNDVEAEAPPPPGAAKTPPAAQPPPGNLVEAWDSRSQPAPPSYPGADIDRSLAQFPASALQLPMKRVDVGGEPVRQAGAESKPARRADESLVRVASELVAGAKDGRVVLRELKQLPKADLEATLAKLDRDGQLEQALGKLSSEQRAALFSRMEQLGLVKVAHGEAPSTAKLNPPRAPDLVLVADGMPPALQSAALAHDRALLGQYRRDEAAYLGRYTAAVGSAKSGAELRELGAHEAPRTIPFPGDVAFYNRSTKLKQAWAGAGGDGPGDTRVRDAIDKRVCELTNRKRPGYSLEGSVGFEGENGGVTRSGTLDSDGHRTDDVEVTAQQKNGAMATVDSQGNVSGGQHQSLGDLDVTDRVGPDGEREVGFELEGKKRTVDGVVAFDKGGAVSKVGLHVDGNGLETDGNKTTFSLGHDGVTASTSVDLKERTMGAAVEVEQKIGDNKLKVKVGFSARGITPEEAKDVARAEGTFATPSLLEAGVPWEKLTAEQQAAFGRFAWTQQEWNSKLPKK